MKIKSGWVIGIINFNLELGTQIAKAKAKR